MNRRDAIARVGLILGGTVIGSEVFLSGCAKKSEVAATGTTFTPETISFLDEVGETILPTTAASPGAKESKIGEFMKTIVSDCYEEKDQKIFMEGIGKLNAAAEKKFANGFMDLSATERHDLLVDVDKEAKDYAAAKKEEDPAHYFTMVKQLTLWGYFTSEVGSTKALRFLPVPGKYDGCYPYKKGDRAWAAT
ncbi:gluconate 2-dehydrogenase subunit 3 family protein [Chryseolinea lacunae]|uniref:Gluconate 2-dehydrogenase subunit 3 family protein n=1 Tax=Chryseolinea lacunae TaxID=2801331 RepID=A0ABS1KLJ7_9BACT|nr:gluconate 2-dehydrogenase subunit 3 family protein [Chryseolinea lacunae]MBL0740340.1 gluconate 2-dehydrogenase subunit 3 family protein [Chryseolinea lacunae]